MKTTLLRVSIAALSVCFVLLHSGCATVQLAGLSSSLQGSWRKVAKDDKSQTSACKYVTLAAQDHALFGEFTKQNGLPDYVFIERWDNVKTVSIARSMVCEWNFEYGEERLVSTEDLSSLTQNDLAMMPEVAAALDQRKRRAAEAQRQADAQRVVDEQRKREQEEAQLKADRELQEQAQRKQEAFYEANKDRFNKDAEAQKGRTLVFKNLYLGMDLGSARAICVHAFQNSPYGVGSVFNPHEEHMAVVGLDVPLEGNQFGLDAMGMKAIGGGMAADKGGRVIGMMFASGAVEHMFNVANMEAKAFVAQFESAYNTPPFKMSVSDGEPFWCCDDFQKGYRVTINSQKELSVIGVKHPSF